MSLGWNVIIGATVAQLFAPQYSFDSQAQGWFSSPLVGSLIGSWLCGVALRFYRQLLHAEEGAMAFGSLRCVCRVCVMASLLTFVGALMAGLTYHYNTHWAGPVVGYGVTHGWRPDRSVTCL